MKHALRALGISAHRYAPWWLLGAAGLAVLSVLIADRAGLPYWRWGMLAVAVAAALLSRFANHNPAAYGLVVVAGVGHLTLTHPLSRFEAGSLSLPQAVTDLLVALGLAALLAFATIRRVGPPKGRDLIEVSVVFLGASISTWVLVSQPLLDAGMSQLEVAIVSSILPLAALVTTFLIDLWNDGLRANRALQLAVVAAILFTTATVTSRLALVAAASNLTLVLPFSAYSLAAGFMFASMSHRHFQADAVARPPSDPESSSRPRLVIMGTAVLMAVGLMSTIAPTSDHDLLARSTGTVLMIVLVVVRLAIASAQHEAARDSLQRRINLDDLTGLPTRARCIELVTERLDQTWRSGRTPCVLHLNVDRFKHINDSLGHHGANAVLVQLARRLEEAVEPYGADVGRLGGDDFVVIDGSTLGLADAMERVAAIRAALERPVHIDDTTLTVGTSIGIAVAPQKRATTAEEMLRRANVANHQAKLEGASRTAVFDDQMQTAVAKRMDLEHALHGAIGRQEMRLFHQPIIDVGTGKVSGFESLIRWERANGELVSPGAFIAIAEDTGIICELGAWALNDALQRLREWIDGGVVPSDTTISVNVSPRQVADPHFPLVVRDALDDAGVSPRLLWLEITESMMLDEPKLAQTTLRDLRTLGVRIALDDFGTGFSSLSLLQRFPIDRIKIDRAFVQGIAENTNDRSLVRTIVAMAHSMGLDVVAEGVETIHQLQGLRELGCSKAQGYLISHPVPADAMRTTMSALAELTSLSVFSTGLPDAAADEIDDVEAVVVTPPPAPAPIGSGSRGPLTAPML